MSDLQALWIYQEACMKLVDLQNSLASTEAGVTYQKLHTLLSELQKNKDVLLKLIDDKGAELDEFEDASTKLEARFDLESTEIDIMRNDEECTSDEAAESTRAFEALLTDVKLVKAKMLDLVNTLTKAQDKLKEIITKGGRAKKEYDTVKVEYAQEREDQKSKIAELQASIQEHAKAVEPKLLQRFKRIQKMHPDPVAYLDGNTCGGCKMSLPTSVVRKVHIGQELIECENCGRLLSDKEEHSQA